ncbi:aspartate kinase [Aequorivita sinensis]|uniref:aspartate kinase n=1 Tax=Aequorivita sinensis TaxID=1382458 RepID=UPI00230097E2|nr:aspartate kinase [Aequorivita sinensis]
MRIFKFGGASVKDADGVKNVAEILKATEEKNIVVVVSAMGKTTNLLENVIAEYLKNNTTTCNEFVVTFKEYHLEIVNGLFENTNHLIYQKIAKLFDKMVSFLKVNKSKNHAFVYDQVVGYGELVSSTIVSEYLTEFGLKNELIDVRKCLITDDNYRDASVDWKLTQQKISRKVNTSGLSVTQGFLGSENTNNFTTTLGREGSDYTAAIFAYCLNAESVTIWKDVPGVLNADPRYFTKTLLLNRISYREAIELAFYGASVIHPKTLQPLQRKEIPLFVKSFLNPTAPGTCVGKGDRIDPETSCFILKKDLVLISLSSLDFSFMMEDNIGDVFKWLHTYKMKVELIQNSAISFSVCVNDKFGNLEILLAKLREKFRVKWNENVTLYTIRHFNPTEVKAIAENKNVLLKQESKETVQLVIKE